MGANRRIRGGGEGSNALSVGFERTGGAVARFVHPLPVLRSQATKSRAHFNFRIPRARRASAPLDASANANKARQRGKRNGRVRQRMKYRLLVVDDSNIIRNRMQRCLTGTDFELIGLATNGVDALKAMGELKPDAVTMDLTMPQMDGLECIEKMVAIDPNVNILVVSALSDKKTGIKALKLGARGFICKPFTDEQLTASLQEMMNPET